MAWIRAALEGSQQSLEVDFENPGISFASDPLRLARARLQSVISTLDSVTGSSPISGIALSATEDGP